MALLLTVAVGARAQSSDPDPIDLTPSDDGKTWTLASTPAYDVELEVTYYTDKELFDIERLDMGEAVELTKTGDGEWTLTATPEFDVELEVTYYDELMDGDEDDNTALLASLDGQTTDIYLDRTLEKERWYTLCLPFAVDLTADGPLKGVTAKTLSKVEYTSTTLTLTFEAVTSLAAGTPYIVRLPDGALENIIDPLFEGAEISKDLHDVAVTGGTFKGTYAPVSWAAGTKNVLFLQNNKFYYPESAAWVNAFRGYIQLSQDVPTASGAKIVIDFGDEKATGISATDVEEVKNGAWHTLQGLQIDGKSAKKGVYIVNGKKVFIK